MEVDVTTDITYNPNHVTNEHPRGWYLDLSNIPSDYTIKFWISGESFEDVYSKLARLTIIR